LGGGAIGLIISSLTGQTTIKYDSFIDAKAGALFPILFITIACGACSGFHSLIASGTTSKQLRLETDAKPIGYGSMLLEAMVAIMSLACVMILAADDKILKGELKANFIYAQGMVKPIVTQETVNGVLTEKVTPVWMIFWALFGASNQLLAALTLLGVTVWLWKTRRAAWVWFVTGLPCAWMYVMSSWALASMTFPKFFAGENGSFRIPRDPSGAVDLVPWVGLVLLALAALMLVEAYLARAGANHRKNNRRHWLRRRRQADPRLLRGGESSVTRGIPGSIDRQTAVREVSPRALTPLP
jgi:carbon starvation protein CstA